MFWNYLLIFQTCLVGVKLGTPPSPAPPVGYIEQYIQSEVNRQVNMISHKMLKQMQQMMDKVDVDVSSLTKQVQNSDQGNSTWQFFFYFTLVYFTFQDITT